MRAPERRGWARMWWAWLAARRRGTRTIRRARRRGRLRMFIGDMAGRGGRYRLAVSFADADTALSVDYGDRAAALTRARELAAAGAWVSVFGGEHDTDPRLVRLARLRPGSQPRRGN